MWDLNYYCYFAFHIQNLYKATWASHLYFTESSHYPLYNGPDVACTKLHLDILTPLHGLLFPVAVYIFKENNGNQL